MKTINKQNQTLETPAIFYPESAKTLHSNSIQNIDSIETINKQLKTLETQTICYPKSAKPLHPNSMQYISSTRTFDKQSKTLETRAICYPESSKTRTNKRNIENYKQSTIPNLLKHYVRVYIGFRV
jgi:hypothetical protein